MSPATLATDSLMVVLTLPATVPACGTPPLQNVSVSLSTTLLLGTWFKSGLGEGANYYKDDNYIAIKKLMMMCILVYCTVANFDEQ